VAGKLKISKKADIGRMPALALSSQHKNQYLVFFPP